MIEQYDTLKGQFCVQCIRDGKVIDEYVDHNYIMSSARRSMAELFVGANQRHITKLMLGTAGYINGNVYSPITEANGFSKERTKLYSESLTEKSLGQVVTVRTGELISVNGNTYQSRIKGLKTYTLTETVLRDSFNLFDTPLYDYTVGVNSYNYSEYIANTNLATDSVNNDVRLEYDNNNTVTYTFEISPSAGNEQYQNEHYSLFNEACIYINNRIFCMKCFPAKLKDDSTSLKIIWKIIF